MVEPEVAFSELPDNMDLAEAFLKRVFGDVLSKCAEDMDFFNQRIDDTILATLSHVVESAFERVSYTDAISILESSGEKFDFPVQWGIDLQSEHERFLTEEHFNSPVTVYNYPKSVKPFYMRSNEPDDQGRETVTAMDVLVPGIGEIIGGAQREERLEVLKTNMAAHQLNEEDYGWYLDLRKYGTCPHAGFGMGFERMLMFVTGMKNIRDVIPFSRTPGSCEF